MECAHPVAGAAPRPARPPAAVGPASPRSYTPRHLAEKILAARSTLTGERKQVTVLFADVKGSTELIRDLDAEDAQQLLDGATQVMMDAVHRFEGTVSRSMGDGVMALFGAPIAHEDHAVRACYAALALQDGMRRYADEARRRYGIGIEARVGLNSGEVIVRLISDDLHMDYTAMGQTVHLASRMESAALPGGVALTPDVLRLVEGYVHVRSLGRLPIKGLAEPLETFELLGAGTLRTRLQVAAARGLTRFVGRQAELDALHAALERGRAGHGQVAALVGEPGVGKSRLVWELTHSHRTDDWAILESSSVSYGRASSYLPVVDLLKGYFRIEVQDDPRTVREKVAGKVLMLDRALEPILPALLALLDVPTGDPDGDAAWAALDSIQRKRQTIDAVRRLLLRESLEQPLLLVFEDLHWIDAETQAVLDTLLDSIPTAQILLLVDYRPEYQHSWGNRGYYTQLRIDPLGDESAEELLASLLGAHPSVQAVAPVLAERTAGNPLFLEESVRMLVEQGILAGERGAYHLTRDLASVRVPPTVQAILAARIDRLPPEQKQLLQTASVVGKDVPLPLLAAVAGLSDDELHRNLAALQTAEFLYEARLFPDPEYTFKHALTHEVTYGSLLAERKRQLHATLVGAIEQMYPGRANEHAEHLAHHALRAEIWEKAATYCWRAGQRALHFNALYEALASFERALDALRHLPETTERLEQAIDIALELRPLLSLGIYQHVLDQWHDTERQAERLDDVDRLVGVRSAMTQAFYMLGRHQEGVAVGERAVTLAESLDETTRVRARGALAQNHRALGNYQRARALQPEMLALYEHSPTVLAAIVAPVVRGEYAVTLAELGDFSEAIRQGEEAIRASQALGAIREAALSDFYLGTVYLYMGNLAEAIVLFERSLEGCERIQLHGLVPGASTRLSNALALEGRADEAVHAAERAVERAAAIQRTGERSMRAAGLGEAYLVAGRLLEARHQAEQARDIAAETGERGFRAWALRLLGAIAASADPPAVEEAESNYREALALAEELGMRPLQARCQLGLGLLYRDLGRPDESRAALTAAIQLLTDMQMRYWLPTAQAALAQVFSSSID